MTDGAPGSRPADAGAGKSRPADAGAGKSRPADAGAESTRETMLHAIDERIGAVAPRFRAALLAVDRRKFVRESDQEHAYVDEPLPLDTPYGDQVATISAPHAYVLGFAALDLHEGDKLLELGAGSGYGAALAAHVVGANGSVTSVEVDPHLAQRAKTLTRGCPNVTVLHDDGLARADLVANHDKCWLTFAVPEVPGALLVHLPLGGILVAPVGPRGVDQRLLRYSRSAQGVFVADLGPVRFVPARSKIDERPSLKGL